MSILVPLFKKITLVSAVCLLVACGGSEERKSRYMQEGKQLFTEGNYQKAMLSYKNVLQIDPNLTKTQKIKQQIETCCCLFFRNIAH